MTDAVTYVVTRAGAQCPLEIGEKVTMGSRRIIDILGGEVVSLEIIRQNGESVMLKRGPETGAYLEDYEGEAS